MRGRVPPGSDRAAAMVKRFDAASALTMTSGRRAARVGRRPAQAVRSCRPATSTRVTSRSTSGRNGPFGTKVRISTERPRAAMALASRIMSR